MKWAEVEIETREGRRKAIAPEIISASRSTDIPAFYADWFMERMREGYVKWVNPFNRRPQFVSFQRARAIVFWTKNPVPLMRRLGELDERHVAYYFQFTLNDYDSEGLEPALPPFAERVDTFRALAGCIGRDRVIWRFDPLLLTEELDLEALLRKIACVGDHIASYTTKLVFSFADIRAYRKVQLKLKRAGIRWREFDEAAMLEVARGVSALCRRWGIVASTCAEAIDLSRYGIAHNRCIDDDLILRLTNNDPEVRKRFGLDVSAQGQMFASAGEATQHVKDPGQRAECGCVPSKDIGQYDTCPHLCAYCYANSSEKLVERNFRACAKAGESIVPGPGDGERHEVHR